jgi:hypothetical protein
MANCSYTPTGITPQDREFRTAIRSKNIIGCSGKFNNLETNDMTVNNDLSIAGDLNIDDLTVDNLTVNNDASIGNNLTVGGDVTVTGDGTFDTITANTGNITTVNSTTGNITTVNSTTGNITTVNSTTVNSTTGNITTVNSTDVNATNDITAQGDLTGTTLFLQPYGPTYPPIEFPLNTLAVYNVLSYGGDKTGVTDQTALVTSLMGTGNKLLYFPGGAYRFNTGLTVPDNVKIYGEHWGNTVFKFYDNTPGTVFFNLSLNDNAVEDILIEYLGTATDSTIFSGTDLERVRVQRIQTFTSNTPGIFANISGVSRLSFEDCFITTTNTCFIANDSTRFSITDNTFALTSDVLAVQTNDLARVIFTNNVILNASTNLYELNVGGSYFLGNIQTGATNVYTGAGVPQTTILDDNAAELSNVNDGLRVEGTQVLSTQQAAIADDVSGASNQATVNSILAALRAHGLIAT